jgi:hypothetical protein
LFIKTQEVSKRRNVFSKPNMIFASFSNKLRLYKKMKSNGN